MSSNKYYTLFPTFSICYGIELGSSFIKVTADRGVKSPKLTESSPSVFACLALFVFTVLHSPSPFLPSAVSSVSLKTLKAWQHSLPFLALFARNSFLFSLHTLSPSVSYLNSTVIAYLGRNKSQLNACVWVCGVDRVAMPVSALHAGLCLCVQGFFFSLFVCVLVSVTNADSSTDGP